MTETDFREMARLMYWQLKSQRLSVELSESQMTTSNGRLIRVATELNPDWYRSFCRQYSPSSRARIRQRRKHDTYIKRRHTLRALKELAGGHCDTTYAHRLRPVVEREFKRLVTAVENGLLVF